MKHKKMAALTAATLIACGPTNELHRGRVLSKHFEPEDSYVTFVCSAYSSNGTCTANVPIWHTDSEEYRLLISGCTETEHKGCRHETHLTDRDSFNKIEPGDIWSDT